MHLEPSRMRDGVRVLRVRGCGLETADDRRRDRRPSAPRPSRARLRPARSQRRIHGYGGAAPQLRRRRASACLADPSGRPRSVETPRDGVN